MTVFDLQARLQPAVEASPCVTHPAEPNCVFLTNLFWCVCIDHWSTGAAYSYLPPDGPATDVRILQTGINGVVSFGNPGRYGDYSASCVVANEIWTMVNYAGNNPQDIPTSVQWSAALWVTPRLDPASDNLEPFASAAAGAPASGTWVPPAGDAQGADGVERVPSDGGDIAAWDIGR
jgi:hypothetical protein